MNSYFLLFTLVIGVIGDCAWEYKSLEKLTTSVPVYFRNSFYFATDDGLDIYSLTNSNWTNLQQPSPTQNLLSLPSGLFWTQNGNTTHFWNGSDLTNETLPETIDALTVQSTSVYIKTDTQKVYQYVSPQNASHYILDSAPRSMQVSISNQDYVFFAGGSIAKSWNGTNDDVDILHGGNWSTHKLSTSRSLLMAFFVNEKFVFCGDRDDSTKTIVDMFDVNTGKWSNLTLSGYYSFGSVNGDYLMLSHPNTSSIIFNTVNNSWIPIDMPSRARDSSVSIGDSIVFSGKQISIVDIYNPITNQWKTSSLSDETSPNRYSFVFQDRVYFYTDRIFDYYQKGHVSQWEILNLTSSDLTCFHCDYNNFYYTGSDGSYCHTCEDLYYADIASTQCKKCPGDGSQPLLCPGDGKNWDRIMILSLFLGFFPFVAALTVGLAVFSLIRNASKRAGSAYRMIE